MAKIECGVPQGSVLGPLFFIMFINDLPMGITAQSHILFADDTTLVNCASDMDNLKLMQKNSMCSAKQWFDDNRLVMNAEKTTSLTFSLKIDNLIGELNKIKSLGVVIDNRLLWTGHIDYLAGRLSSVVYQIRKLLDYCDLETALVFYRGNFESLLRYSILVWGNSTSAVRIFLIQKKAVRALLKKSKFQSCRELFKKLKLLPLACLFILESVVFAKINETKFKRNLNYHSYDTRNKDNFVIPYHRIKKAQQSAQYTSAILFNALPKKVKEKPLPLFKSTVRDILEGNCFYTVDEFLVAKLATINV